MRKLYGRGLAVTVGALVAIAGGAVAVTAATSTPTSTPSTTHSATAHPHHHHWARRTPTLQGFVVGTASVTASVPGSASPPKSSTATPSTTTNGSPHHFVLTITPSGGTPVTVDLTGNAKVWQYHGPKVKRTSAAVSSLDGALVAVRYAPKATHHVARTVLVLAAS